MHGDAVDGSDASTEIAVDDGAHVAVAQPDVVEIPADLLDVDDALEGDPTSTVEMPLRLRIRDRYPQISRELLTHLATGGTSEGYDLKMRRRGGNACISIKLNSSKAYPFPLSNSKTIPDAS